LFAFGIVLAFAMGMVQVHRGAKGERGNASVPNNVNVADEVGSALNVVDQINGKFFEAFEALPDEDQAGTKGAHIGHIFHCLSKAYDQIDVRGEWLAGTRLCR
jgi:hypothetical protein